MSQHNEHRRLQNRRWVFLGVMVIFLVFFGGGYWATVTRISGAIIAPGTIGVASKIKTVEHLEGGVVENILVSNGDRVEFGDVLVELDDTNIRANLNIISNNLMELLAREARLNAELHGSEEIVFPNEIMAQSLLPHVQQIMDDKVSIFKNRRSARVGQKRILSQQIIHLKQQIEGIEAQKAALDGQSGLLSDNIARKEEAARSGLVTQDSMELLRRQRMQLLGDTGALQSEIARIKSTITQTELQILQIDIDLRQSVETELRDVSNKISEFREQKFAVENRLERSKILAPVTGLVHNLALFTVGGVVAPGAPILQIIPTDDRLIVEAHIATSDIDQIQVGQEAFVLLSAFDTRTTPRLAAKITKISAAQIVDKVTGAPFFTLEVEIKNSELSRLSEDQKLLPGMPAETFIQTGDRSPLDYFLKPLMVQILRAFKET